MEDKEKKELIKEFYCLLNLGYESIVDGEDPVEVICNMRSTLALVYGVFE